MKWQLLRISGDPTGENLNVVTFRQDRRKISVYPTSEGIVALLSDGDNVTEKLSQKRWREIYAKAVAACAILGKLATYSEEII